MKSRKEINTIYNFLTEAYAEFDSPSVTSISNLFQSDPYLVLLSTIISLRTKDEVTLESSKRLFNVVKIPQDAVAIDILELEKLLYPAGFYKVKAQRIKELSFVLIEKFNGNVPDTIEELLTLKGVGRKTANLVLAEGFKKDAICVDIHVHRICNRLGVVKTKKPDDTEFALRKILPKKYWIKWNEMLVTFGQKICRPISPFCSACILSKNCSKVDITTSR